MPLTITDYRADIDNLLATLPDVTVWTAAIKDEAIRQAIFDYSRLGPVYESDFIVPTTGYEHDLSTITDLYQIVSLAWPWDNQASFDLLNPRWRTVSRTTVRFESGEPTAGEIIRVRYRKLHRITDLDGAVSTTVPDVDRRIVGVKAALWCLDQRLRQVAENQNVQWNTVPYKTLHERLSSEWEQRIRDAAPVQRVVWNLL